MITWDKGTTVKRSGVKLKLLEGHCLAADTGILHNPVPPKTNEGAESS